MRRRSEVSVACALVLLGATTVVHAQTTCTGDCNGDGEVTINELILGVNIALGSQPLSACEAFDCEGTGMVPINCLVQGVNNALNGCNPSPTPTPAGGTEFTYNIDPGVPGVGPDQSGTGIFVGIIGNTNAAVAFSNGPLTLVMGTPDSNGIASLTLKNDVTFSVDIIDGSCLCFKLHAADEGNGSINCNGGSMYDTLATGPPNPPTQTSWTVTTGLGSPSGAGDANLLVTGELDHLSGACAAADCPNHTYSNPPNTFAFTTTNATANQEVTSGPPITVTNPGSPFNCATFGMPGSAGKLAAPLPTVIDPVGPVATTLRLAEMAPQ